MGMDLQKFHHYETHPPKFELNTHHTFKQTQLVCSSLEFLQELISSAKYANLSQSNESCFQTFVNTPPTSNQNQSIKMNLHSCEAK
jgi:hypothetical protein